MHSPPPPRPPAPRPFPSHLLPPWRAAGRCVAAGATHVVVAPYFLSRGRHIQDDIPALVADARAQHPGVQFSVAAPIGARCWRAAGCVRATSARGGEGC
jgi:sirohydrochlorin ferrochelatase